MEDINLSKGQKSYLKKIANDFKEESSLAIKEVEDFKKEVLIGDGENPSLKDKLIALEATAAKIVEEIEGFHSKVYEEDEDTGTILADEVDEVIEKLKERQSEAQAIRDKIISLNKELFGFTTEKGEKVNGVADEIKALKKTTDETLNIYNDQYTALKEKIEGLLPGATTVGIAKAFNDHKESFKTPNTWWTVAFMASIGFMLFISFWFSKPVETWTGLSIQIMNKLPYFIPAIWLAIYASKQRSQNKRLMQEYAYKEDVAKSFQGYKKEIELIGESDEVDELKLKYMETLIRIIGENPTSTLESISHKERTPVHDILSKKIEKDKE